METLDSAGQQGGDAPVGGDAQKILFHQYGVIREEIEKSIFVQYEVIRIGALILGSLLVFIPAVSEASGKISAPVLCVTLLCLAFIALAFVFIMGAGEIRIIRAAAFSNHLLGELALSEDSTLDRSLLWDEFVSTWNRHLTGGKREWLYRERTYLAVPFLIIAVLADIGAGFAVYMSWHTQYDDCLLFAVIAAVAVQGFLLLFLNGLSNKLVKATRACSEELAALRVRPAGEPPVSGGSE
jgi:hypothetical protein